MYGPLGFLFDLPCGNVTDAVRQGPDRDLDRRPHARGGAVHGRRRGHLRGRPAALGRARGAGGRGGAGVRVPAGRLLARGGHRRGRAGRRGAGAVWSVRAADEGRTRDYVLAGAAAGLAIAFKYTAGLALLPLAIAALARLRADGARAARSASRSAGSPRPSCSSLLNPYLFGSLGDWWTDLRDQADVAAQDAEAGPGVGRLLVLPRQPHLGPRLGRHRCGARRRACWCCGATGARARAGRHAARAVRLPERCSRATSGAGCCPPTRRWRCWPRWRWCGPPSAAPARSWQLRARPPRLALRGARPAAGGRRAHRAGARPRGHAQQARASSTAATRRSCGCRSSRRCRAATSARTPRAACRAWLHALPAARPGWTEPGWSYVGRRRPARVRPVQARPVRAARRRRARLRLPRRARPRA